MVCASKVTGCPASGRLKSNSTAAVVARLAAPAPAIAGHGHPGWGTAPHRQAPGRFLAVESPSRAQHLARHPLLHLGVAIPKGHTCGQFKVVRTPSSKPIKHASMPGDNLPEPNDRVAGLSSKVLMRVPLWPCQSVVQRQKGSGLYGGHGVSNANKAIQCRPMKSKMAAKGRLRAQTRTVHPRIVKSF